MPTMQYKSVAVGGVTEVKDKGRGRVTAFVSVTGLEDNVNDVILPGAYEKTLKARIPKGAWGHDWKTPTARTESVKELLPGSPELPKELSDGTPWPKEAGALKVDMLFNMKTQRGREAYADVVFFGNQQEWSIGYSVPEGGSYKKGKTRYIKELNCYEYSPVLFGAMSHARTATSVKDAQFAMMLASGKTLEEIVGLQAEVKSFLDSIEEEMKSAGVDWALEFKADDEDREEYPADFRFDKDGSESTPPKDDEEDEDDEESEEYEDDEEDEDEETKSDFRRAMADAERLVNALGTKDDGGPEMGIGQRAYIEGKALDYDTAEDAAEDYQGELDNGDLVEAAKAFDAAVDGGDTNEVDSTATDLLDAIEDMLGEEKGETEADHLSSIALYVHDRMIELEGDEAHSQREYGDAEKSLPDWIGDLDDDVLKALGAYVEEVKDEGMLAYVLEEVDVRPEVKSTLGSVAGSLSFLTKPKRRIRKGHERRARAEGDRDQARVRGTGRVGPRTKKKEDVTPTVEMVDTGIEAKDLNGLLDLMNLELND